jgi:hypothetical protein
MEPVAFSVEGNSVRYVRSKLSGGTIAVQLDSLYAFCSSGRHRKKLRMRRRCWCTRRSIWRCVRALASLRSRRRATRAGEQQVVNRTTLIQVKSWEEFEGEIGKLEEPGRPRWDELWFRGQANANWGLDTTLERRYGPSHAVGAYLRLINRIKPMIETFTGASFVTPETQEIQASVHNYDLFHNFILSGITYMAHLRHNGFPSPLLDWSSSPYVAAFFAFARAAPGTDVAVFVYRERPTPTGIKIGGSESPQIFSVGPLVKTHKRHFRQQSRYTICAKFEMQNEWVFANHGTVFGIQERGEQDLLWKIVITAGERVKVLRHLDKFNLNEFTLFDSEEGLLEMLAMREFDLLGR